MKKIYFLSLVFTIGFCLALGSCRSGNRKNKTLSLHKQIVRIFVMHKASGWNNTKITDSFISKILKAKPVRNIPSP